jgi:hypothetical protein
MHSARSVQHSRSAEPVKATSLRSARAATLTEPVSLPLGFLPGRVHSHLVHICVHHVYLWESRNPNCGVTPMATPKKKRTDTPSDTDMSTQGIPSVYDERVITLIPMLEEIVTWWEERKTVLDQSQDAGRETRRVTFFVEKRWEDAIRRKADLDSLTYTQIVNEAFRQYFEQK